MGKVLCAVEAVGRAVASMNRIAFVLAVACTVRQGTARQGVGLAPGCQGWFTKPIVGPAGRAGHAMAYDESRSVTVMFGGKFSNDRLSDVWELDGHSWALQSIAGPVPAGRYGHVMAYDPNRRAVMMVGGIVASPTAKAETWYFDGVSWLRMTDAPFKAGETDACAFDGLCGCVTVFNGSSVWNWTGDAWVQRMTNAGPSPRRHSAMAYEPGAPSVGPIRRGRRQHLHAIATR